MARKREPWDDAVAGAPWAAELRPAPGNLRIIQALVNTAYPAAKADELRDPRALADWVGRWRLATAELELGTADLERVIAVREGFRALLRANSRVPLDKDAVAGLDRAVTDATLRVRFLGRHTRFEPAAAGLDGALGRLVWIAAQARSEDTWKRLRVCANEACGRAFYDFSRNGSGKWCVYRCRNLIHSRIFRRKHPGRWPGR